MSGFGYVNQNNPVLISEEESQEMINCRIDRGFLEFCPYEVNEEVPVPNRIVDLPNGKRIMIRPDSNNLFTDEGYIKWRNIAAPVGEWEQPSCYISEAEAEYISVASVDADNPELLKFRPQAAGEFFWAITLFDTRTKEESAPIYKSVKITDEQFDADNPPAIRFTLLPIPRFQTGYYKFRFYRMPWVDSGSTSEYLFSFEHKADFSNASLELYDVSPDENLGDLCNTESLTTVPFGYTDSATGKEFLVRSVVMFDDKLWIGAKDINDNNKEYGLLYYSRTGAWTEFPAENFFSFPSPVVGITTYDQALVIQTLNSVYYLYGEPDNYTIKQIDYKFNGIATNSGQALGQYSYFLNLKEDTNPDVSDGIFIFNGSSIGDISAKIYKEFPAEITHKNWVLNNRYFIFEKSDTRRVIYDTIGGGFCFADGSQHKFYYRTKEFSALPEGKRFIKKVCIRAKGPFILYVVADGDKVITKIRLASDKPFEHFCYVKPRRGITFSLVFEGQEGTEIYDWRLIE